MDEGLSLTWYMVYRKGYPAFVKETRPSRYWQRRAAWRLRFARRRYEREMRERSWICNWWTDRCYYGWAPVDEDDADDSL